MSPNGPLADYGGVALGPARGLPAADRAAVLLDQLRQDPARFVEVEHDVAADPARLRGCRLRAPLDGPLRGRYLGTYGADAVAVLIRRRQLSLADERTDRLNVRRRTYRLLGVPEPPTAPAAPAAPAPVEPPPPPPPPPPPKRERGGRVTLAMGAEVARPDLVRAVGLDHEPAIKRACRAGLLRHRPATAADVERGGERRGRLPAMLTVDDALVELLRARGVEVEVEGPAPVPAWEDLLAEAPRPGLARPVRGRDGQTTLAL